MKKFITIAVGICLLHLAAIAWAGDTLLNTLQKKGVITEEEASTIMAEQLMERKSIIPRALEGLSIGALAHIDYSAGTTGHDGTDFNEFSLTRGYINIRKDLNPWLRVRVTPDVTRKSDGDIALRMKYYYADFLLQDSTFFTENNLRFGLAQTPWLDFQQQINIYRMQGSMFQERFGKFNSADLGIGLIGNLGGKLSKESQEEVGYHTPYAGKYGSYHIGVYNGGGYHAAEANQNKVIEGRVTLRPAPSAIPGLQLSYFGITGKGNDPANPEWRVNSGFLSYQNQLLVLTGEYVQARGNQSGSDEKNKNGYSFFGDFKLPMYHDVAIMARYDAWDPDKDTSDDEETLLIGGVSYNLYGNNYLLVAYEQDKKEGLEDNKKGQVVYQISY